MTGVLMDGSYDGRENMALMSVNQPEACPNCSAELHGPFCASCGQRQLDLDRPFRELAGEAMDAFLSFDSRILRTMGLLLSKPGLLSEEFLEGRQRRYVHPFKLYFAISVVLFLTLSLSGFVGSGPQPESLATGIRMVFCVFTAGMLLLSLIPFQKYELTEARFDEIKRLIREKAAG